MRERIPAVYLIVNRKNGTIYTGVTSNLPARIYQHKKYLVKGFTSQYKLTRLVHYEVFATMEQVITREKRIKKWKPAWKIELIEKDNPTWRDLYLDIL